MRRAGGGGCCSTSTFTDSVVSCGGAPPGCQWPMLGVAVNAAVAGACAAGASGTPVTTPPPALTGFTSSPPRDVWRAGVGVVTQGHVRPSGTTKSGRVWQTERQQSAKRFSSREMG